MLADSTMYGVWGKEMPANTCHFDIDSIVGGQMRDMTRALIKNYLHMPNRLEIIVIAGINNIGRGHSPENVMEDVEEMRKVVKATGGGTRPQAMWQYAPCLWPPSIVPSISLTTLLNQK